MTKTGIKIIKRINAAAKKIVAVAIVHRTAEEDRRRLGIVVEDWIRERHENSQLERLFSENKIDEWKALPKS